MKKRYHLEVTGNEQPKKRQCLDKTVFNKIQKSILDVVKSGENVFFTGPAGTGKSTLVKEIINLSEKKHGRKGILSLAPTGMAASVIGGSTIHSGLKIPVVANSDLTLQRWLKYVKKKPILKKLPSIKVFIIDEMSMVGDGLFNLIIAILEHTHPKHNKFQLIMCGDGLQLLPVKARFFIETESWKNMIVNRSVRIFTLEKIYRQKDGGDWANVLQKIRLGNIDNEVKESLFSISRPEECYPDIDPETAFTISERKDVPNTQIYTHLTPHKATAERINQKVLEELPGDLFTSEAIDIFFSQYVPSPESFEKNWKVPKSVILKAGSLVMHVINDQENGLVNGSQGIVEKFDKNCITVKFFGDKGKPPRSLKIGRHTFDFKSDGKLFATRTQFPLLLANAITIHKSQGTSIRFLCADIDKIFTDGQAYVALSRSICKENVVVWGLNSLDKNCYENDVIFSRMKPNATFLDFLTAVKKCTDSEGRVISLNQDLCPGILLEGADSGQQVLSKYFSTQ